MSNKTKKKTIRKQKNEPRPDPFDALRQRVADGYRFEDVLNSTWVRNLQFAPKSPEKEVAQKLRSPKLNDSKDWFYFKPVSPSGPVKPVPELPDDDDDDTYEFFRYWPKKTANSNNHADKPSTPLPAADATEEHTINNSEVLASTPITSPVSHYQSSQNPAVNQSVSSDSTQQRSVFEPVESSVNSIAGRSNTIQINNNSKNSKRPSRIRDMSRYNFTTSNNRSDKLTTTSSSTNAPSATRMRFPDAAGTFNLNSTGIFASTPVAVVNNGQKKRVITNLSRSKVLSTIPELRPKELSARKNIDMPEMTNSQLRSESSGHEQLSPITSVSRKTVPKSTGQRSVFNPEPSSIFTISVRGMTSTPLKSTRINSTQFVMSSGKWRRILSTIVKARKGPLNRLSLNARNTTSIRKDTRSRVILKDVGEIQRTPAGATVHDSASEVNSNQKATLLTKCKQTSVLAFDEIYSKSALKRCQKIGEGVFGEVFLNHVGRTSYVIKIIPIEGTEIVNGAVQKRYNEILQEVVISQELSGLRHDDNEYQTAGFVEVLNVRLVQGRYPAHLLAKWEAYDKWHHSENESPECFGENQLYVVFELANSGTDLEKFEFKNADQSYSVFKQVAFSLAVAESKFKFEHRDLHWGNILIAPTTQKTLQFTLNGKTIAIPSKGVKATIIDYTLSRIQYNNCCLYQDLAADPELFEAVGDYQFEIYRLMRARTENHWERFEPYTNLLWIHYVLDKIIEAVHYSGNKTNKNSKIAFDKMEQMKVDLFKEHNTLVGFVEKKLFAEEEN